MNMTCCGHCRDAGDIFNDRTAKRDLKKYLRRGPDKATGLLIRSLLETDVGRKSLLDIGGGIGAIQLELFKQGLGKSVNVDASRAYQSVSEQAASRRGYAGQTEYYYGDFAELAGSLPVAHIVTLDKVICCYPDAEKLLEHALQKTGSLIGLVFPRETFITRIGFRLGNLWFRLRKSEFRTYLHPFDKINKIIRSRGFREKNREKTILWKIIVYEKAE